MANEEHLNLLKQETAGWNEWRIRNSLSLPDVGDGSRYPYAKLSGSSAGRARRGVSGTHARRRKKRGVRRAPRQSTFFAAGHSSSRRLRGDACRKLVVTGSRVKTGRTSAEKRDGPNL